MESCCTLKGRRFFTTEITDWAGPAGLAQGRQGHVLPTHRHNLNGQGYRLSFFLQWLHFKFMAGFQAQLREWRTIFSGDFHAEACRYFSSRQSEVSTVVVVAQIIDSQVFPQWMLSKSSWMHLASLNIKALSLKRHFLATFGNGGALWEVMPHGDDSRLTYMCKIEVTCS